jgi:hypothetical protein
VEAQEAVAVGIATEAEAALVVVAVIALEAQGAAPDRFAALLARDLSILKPAR